MQKRVVSFVLVLCMLLAMVPAIALPVLAEDVTATVTFKDGNTAISTQTVTGTTLEFTVPAVPSDAFGWYNISPAGVIREASTFIGDAAADVTFYLLGSSSTFSPTTNWPLYTSKTSLDGFRGGWTAGSYISNAYTPFNRVNSHNILENKDIWNYGGIYLGEKRLVTQKKGMLALSYNVPANGVIDVDFEALRVDVNTDGCVFSDTAMAIAINGVIVWPQSAAGQKVQNNPVTGTDYIFPYNNQGSNTNTTFVGDIATNWAYFSILGQEVPENYTDLSDMSVETLGFDYNKYLGHRSGWETALANAEDALEEAQASGDEAAIAAAQAKVDAAKVELAKYDQVRALCRPVTSVAKTGDLLSAYEEFCEENGFPHDLAVKAGDRVDIVFNRVNNPHITAFPTVTYDKVTGPAIAEDTVFDYDFVGSELVAGGTNWPVLTKTSIESGKPGAYAITKDFGSGWSFVAYNNGAVAKQTPHTHYYTFGNWNTGILWLDDYGITRCNIEGAAPNFQNYGVGFAYAAPYTGTVNIDASFATPIATTSRTVYFSIVKVNAEGATVVYPVAGATGSNIANVATEGAGVKYNDASLKNESVTGIEVTKGDQLVFVWRDSNVVNVTGWSNGDCANAFNLAVAYTDYLPGTTFDPANNQSKPTFEAVQGSTITYYNNWDLVSHAGLTDYTPGKSINLVMNDTGDYASPGYLGYEWGSRPTNETYGFTKGADNWPGNFGVWPMLNSTGGWRYTAPYSGTLDLSLLSLQSRHNFGTFGYVAVFQNGKMIWPVAEGADTNYYGSSDKWAVIGTYNTRLDTAAIAALAVKDGSEKTGTLSNITVQAGDEIEILVRNDDTATGFWSSDNKCGFMCTAAVEYIKCDLTSAIVDPLFTTRLDENLPAAPDKDAVLDDYVYAPVFGDPAWSFVNFPKEIITKENAVTKYLAMNRKGNVEGWGDGFWGYDDNGANRPIGWGTNTIFRMVSGATWGPAGSLSCNDQAIGGYRYTAPATGKINVDITKLWTMATDAKVTVGEGEEAVEVPKKNGAITVAIFIDCQKVWPADDSWYVLAEQGVDYAPAVAASIKAALSNVIVGAGSTIDFLVGNPNNLDSWATRGTVFQAAVSYVEQYPVSATGAVSVGDSFTFTADAEAGAAKNIKADVVTVAAKDVCNEFTYTVTGEIEGKTITLATGVTTMKDALMAYVTNDAANKVSNMAVAALNYAAAAQKYFAPETADAALANAGLTEAQKTVTTAGGYTAAERVATVEDAQAQLLGISLLLEEKIALKLVFDTNVEGAQVQMADNAAFNGARTVAYTATKDGNAYKAITEGIGAANYNSLIYIRVVDAEGNVISNTIAYSVAAYCKNMEGTVGAVANAILALYDAANAYKNA